MMRKGVKGAIQRRPCLHIQTQSTGAVCMPVQIHCLLMLAEDKARDGGMSQHCQARGMRMG